MDPVESLPKPGWKSSLRTVAFGALIAALLLAVVLGELSPSMARLPQQAEMLRRGGDTFMRLYYLATDANWQPDQTRPFLRTAVDFYSRAAKVDPTDYETNLRVAFTLRLLGLNKEAQTFLFPQVEFKMTESERAALSSVYAMMLESEPPAAAIDRAKDFLFTLAPGPALVAESYRKIGRPELAEQTIAAAAAQSRPTLRALLAAVIVNGLVVLSGVWLLAWSLVNVRRGSFVQAEAVGAEGLPTRAVGLREAAEALILWIFFGALFAKLLSLTGGVHQRPMPMVLLPALLAELAAIAWVWVVTGFRVRFGWNWKRAGRNALFGAAATGVAVLPALGIYAAFQNLLHRSAVDDPLLPLLLSPKGFWGEALVIGLVGLVGPALEETLFRGILFGGLRRQWSFWPAAAVSAALFALAHMSIAGFASYAMLGLVFAGVYEWRRSLVAPWMAHAVFNVFNLVVLFALFR
jgi:membrane protease YdiL (CAAX protease family)